MTEEMLKVLNDESFTTNEERVEAQKKALATLVIPKDKFNEEIAKRKLAEEKVASLESKIASLESSNENISKTGDERVQNLENQLNSINAKYNRSQVESILKGAGLTEADYKDDLDNMDLSDEKKALAYANSVVKLINANTEKVKKETQASLLSDTPKPIIGGANASTATMDKLVAEYDQAIKNKDQVAQTRLMRQIQEERVKTASNIK